MRGIYPRVLYSPRQTPHPSAMVRIASTLCHKGRGEAGTTADRTRYFFFTTSASTMVTPRPSPCTRTGLISISEISPR